MEELLEHYLKNRFPDKRGLHVLSYQNYIDNDIYENVIYDIRYSYKDNNKVKEARSYISINALLIFMYSKIINNEQGA